MPLKYDGTDPDLPGGWLHDDGTLCPVYLAPDNGTRWWCTDHQQYLKRPEPDVLANAHGRSGPVSSDYYTHIAGEIADAGAAIPDIDRATATDEEKLAWVKARSAAEPWSSALASVIQDMDLMGIPLNPDLAMLGMSEAIIGGEQGIRRFIDGLTLGSIAREARDGG
jgi:hypothetical protein